MIQLYRTLPQKEQISYSQLQSDINESIQGGNTYNPELLKEFGKWVDECTNIYPLTRAGVLRMWEVFNINQKTYAELRRNYG